MSTGRSSCGSLASSAKDNQADSDRECPADWPQGSARQASLGRPPHNKPWSVSHVSKVTRDRHRRERSTAAIAAWLHWLAIVWREAAAASAESAIRPALAAGGTAWQSGGPAAAGSPAGQRRPTVGPEAAGSAGQSRTAVRRQRTRPDRGIDRWTAVTAVPP